MIKFTNELLQELSERIYAQNKNVGWWDNPRSFDVIICLIHSEVSEAMEGDRKNLKDDHLIQYPMCVVELADTAIRIMDFLGHVQFKFYLTDRNLRFNEYRFTSLHDALASIHFNLSVAYDCYKNYNLDETARFVHLYLQTALCQCLAAMTIYFPDLDPLQIIEEKLEYNKQRLDHKRENRSKQDGKKY